MQSNAIKIFLIFIFTFIIGGDFLFADIKLKAPNSFMKGDGVSFEVYLTGKDIDYSDITKIDKYKVELRGTSSQLSITNGRYQKSIIKQYVFYPINSVTIPPIYAKIDGKRVSTKAHLIKANKIRKTIGADFSLDIKVDKKTAYVGEPIKLTLVFAYKLYSHIQNVGLSNINIQDVWIKPLKEQKNYQKGEYGYKEISYLLFGQKPTKAVIGPLFVSVYENDGIFGNTERIYSNTIKLNIKNTPNSTNLVGNFHMEAQVDKTIVKIGEPISLSLKVSGEGNIDDLDDFGLNVDGATIYENKPIIKYGLQNGKYGGTYSKVFSILATKNTTIPSFKLDFFDPKTKTIKHLTTNEIKINVLENHFATNTNSHLILGNNTIEPTIKIKEKIVYKDISLWQKIMYFIAGFLACILSWFVYKRVSKLSFARSGNKELIKDIKRAKNSNELIQTIIHLSGEHKQIDEILKHLDNKTFKDVKKQLLHHLKHTNKIYNTLDSNL